MYGLMLPVKAYLLMLIMSDEEVMIVLKIFVTEVEYVENCCVSSK